MSYLFALLFVTQKKGHNKKNFIQSTYIISDNFSAVTQHVN